LRRRTESAKSSTGVSSIESQLADPEVSQIEREGAARYLLAGERDHRFYIFKREKIDYIEAHGNYVKLNVGGIEYLKRDSLKQLSTFLAASGFVRIERSLLINIGAVFYVQRVGRGVFAFTFPSGAHVRSSPNYRRQILDALPLTRTSLQGGRRSNGHLGQS
jgi:two-component system LytT family response regulator